MIIAGCGICRKKVFTAKEASMYDRINLEKTRLDEYTAFVAALLSTVEKVDKGPVGHKAGSC